MAIRQCKKCGKEFNTDLLPDGTKTHSQNRAKCYQCHKYVHRKPSIVSKVDLLPDDEFINIVLSSHNYYECAQKIGLSNRDYKILKRRIKKLNIDTSHLNNTFKLQKICNVEQVEYRTKEPESFKVNKIDNVVDEDFINIVQSSNSYLECLNKIGLNHNSTHYRRIKNRISSMNICIDHFSRVNNNHNYVYVPKSRPIESYLIENSSMVAFSGLRKRLLNEGLLERKCYDCELTEWKGQPIPLQLHHINGKPSDCRLENLTVLCPNCHALTDNYCGKNNKS